MRRAKIAMSFRHLALCPHMTVADIVADRLKVKGVGWLDAGRNGLSAAGSHVTAMESGPSAPLSFTYSVRLSGRRTARIPLVAGGRAHRLATPRQRPICMG